MPYIVLCGHKKGHTPRVVSFHFSSCVSLITHVKAGGAFNSCLLFISCVSKNMHLSSPRG